MLCSSSPERYCGNLNNIVAYASSHPANHVAKSRAMGQQGARDKLVRECNAKSGTCHYGPGSVNWRNIAISLIYSGQCFFYDLTAFSDDDPQDLGPFLYELERQVTISDEEDVF